MHLITHNLMIQNIGVSIHSPVTGRNTISDRYKKTTTKLKKSGYSRSLLIAILVGSPIGRPRVNAITNLAKYLDTTARNRNNPKNTHVTTLICFPPEDVGANEGARVAARLGDPVAISAGKQPSNTKCNSQLRSTISSHVTSTFSYVHGP